MAPYDATTHSSLDVARPSVRRITAQDVFRSLRRGYDDFLAMPTHLLFLGLFYPVFGLVLGVLLFSETGLPLLFPLVAGFALVGPILATPIYEVSRRREQGARPGWSDAIAVLQSPSLMSIIVVSIVLLAIFIAWMAAAQAIYGAIYGPLAPEGWAAFFADVTTTSRGWALILIGHAVGFVFAAIVFTLSVVSLPLLVDRDVGAGVAIRTSIAAVRRNPGPMALWAAIIAGVLIVASIPLLVGLVLAVPILGHATWHLYRCTVDGETVAATHAR